MTWVMRVTQAMAQIGEFGGQGWGVGIVFVSSPNGPGEETESGWTWLIWGTDQRAAGQTGDIIIITME